MRFPKILLTTAMIAASSAAFAQGWHGDHHGDELFRGLNLTDAQQAQVDTIEQAGRDQAHATMDQMRAVHEQIMARMLSPGTVTEADIAPLVSQEETLRNQLDQMRVDRGLQMRQVLTPAQLADAATKHEQLVSLHDQERAVVEPASTK